MKVVTISMAVALLAATVTSGSEAADGTIIIPDVGKALVYAAFMQSAKYTVQVQGENGSPTTISRNLDKTGVTAPFVTDFINTDAQHHDRQQVTLSVTASGTATVLGDSDVAAWIYRDSNGIPTGSIVALESGRSGRQIGSTAGGSDNGSTVTIPPQTVAYLTMICGRVAAQQMAILYGTPLDDTQMLTFGPDEAQFISVRNPTASPVPLSLAVREFFTADVAGAGTVGLRRNLNLVPIGSGNAVLLKGVFPGDSGAGAAIGIIMRPISGINTH